MAGDRCLEVTPDLKTGVPEEEIDSLEAEYKRVKAKRTESIRKKRRPESSQPPWRSKGITNSPRYTARGI